MLTRATPHAARSANATPGCTSTLSGACTRDATRAIVSRGSTPGTNTPEAPASRYRRARETAVASRSATGPPSSSQNASVRAFTNSAGAAARTAATFAAASSGSTSAPDASESSRFTPSTPSSSSRRAKAPT
ncbi:hypothetical protein ABIC29_003064 [Agromyces sp. PvR057]